jgi:hypothetical protein
MLIPIRAIPGRTMILSMSSFRRAGALLSLAACGCSVMRELPRDQYAGQAERRNVRVETRAGESLEFERVKVTADSLTGLKQKDVESQFDEYDQVTLPLAEVRRMSVRQVDWYRTCLIGGVAAAVALAAVLSQTGKGGDTSGQIGPCGSRPCP